MAKNKVLKVQILNGIENPKKEKEKECFLTFHASTNKQKAQLLENIVSNPQTKFRIFFTNETPKAGDWYEELVK